MKAKELLKMIGEASNLDDIDVSAIIDFAKDYRSLGSSIQDQLEDLLNNDFDSVNPNAIKEIKRKLASHHYSIKDACDEYEEWQKENG
jgi:predicted nucleotidyltransferase